MKCSGFLCAVQDTAVYDVGTVRVRSQSNRLIYLQGKDKQHIGREVRWSARDGPLVLLGRRKLASLGISPCELYCGMRECPRFFRILGVVAHSQGSHVWVLKKRARSLTQSLIDGPCR